MLGSGRRRRGLASSARSQYSRRGEIQWRGGLCRGRWRRCRAGRPGAGAAESAAKSQTASRSCLSAAQRKLRRPWLCRTGGWRVPRRARRISEAGSGKWARQSPISASSRAARTVPERGREVDVVGVQGECSAISVASALICAARAGQHGRQGAGGVRLGGPVVTGGAAGAAASRWCSSAGLVAAAVAVAFQPAAMRLSDSQPGPGRRSGPGTPG